MTMTIMKIASWISLIFGWLVCVSLFATDAAGKDNFYYMFAIAFSFVVLGALGREYVRRQYKGGAPTIIGAIFGLFGVQFIVLSAEHYLKGLDAELVTGGAAAAITFLVPGLILLHYGHKVHKKANKSESLVAKT